jgi:Ca2+/Na+ antiporter
MHAYKRSVVLQLGVFGFFFFYGLDNILFTLMDRTIPVIIGELVVTLILIGVFLYFYYKTPKEVVYVVKKASMDKIKYVLYTVAFSLLISIVFSGFQAIEGLELYAEIITGAITSLAGLYGVYVGLEIIQQNK